MKYHVGKVIRYSPYLLQVVVLFRRVVLQIWVVYFLLNNKEIVKKTHKSLVAGICKEKRINTYNIVKEDFNKVEKLNLDTNNAEQKVQSPEKSCLAWLKNIGYVDNLD